MPVKTLATTIALALLVAGCGDGTTPGLEVCEDLPPFNATYGPPSKTLKEPEEPPHDTVQYLWNCVSTDLTSPDGDPPGGAPYVGVTQTWQRQDNNCWIDLGEEHSPDPRCGAEPATAPTP